MQSYNKGPGYSGRREYSERCGRREDRRRDSDPHRAHDIPGKQVDHHKNSNSLESDCKRRNHEPYEDEKSEDQDLMIPKKTHTSILLTNLPTEVKLEEIRAAMGKLHGPRPEDIDFFKRIGTAYCFAIVVFLQQEDRTKWMSRNKRKVVIFGKRAKASLWYYQPSLEDWLCKYCGLKNYKKTWSCVKCGVGKLEISPGSQQQNKIKTDTLMFNNIPPSTNVHRIQLMLAPFANLCVRNISLFEYKDSGVNKKYALIKLHSPWMASHLHTVLFGLQPLQLGENKLTMCYARTDGRGPSVGENLKDKTDPASTAAHSTSTQQGAVSTSGSVAPAEVSSNSTASASPMTSPDISKYKYDEATGYYYNPQTDLYYDPSSQFFYNAGTQEYLLWDSKKRKHVPVQSESNTTGEEPKEKKKKCKDKTPLQKDMDRWTKVQNELQKKNQCKKESSSQNLETPKKEQNKESTATHAEADAVADPTGDVNAVADAHGSEFESKREDFEMMCLMLQQFRKSGNEIFKSDSVDVCNASGDPKDCGSARTVEPEERETDWLLCSLCQLQFPTKETLQHHERFSDLHKRNLEIQRNAAFHKAEVERRETENYGTPQRGDLYGVSESHLPQRAFYQPPPATINDHQRIEDGLARHGAEGRIMEPTSWQERGMERHYQDITASNSASFRTGNTGLGVERRSYGLSSSDANRDTPQRDTFTRFPRYTL